MKDLIKKWKLYRKEMWQPIYLVDEEGNMKELGTTNTASFEDFMDWLTKEGRYQKNLPRA